MNILDTEPSVQNTIREFRNRNDIRAYMYNDHLISEAEHAAWLERLGSSNRNLVYVIFLHGKPAGIVSLNQIDRTHQRADWAFYLVEEARGGGVGARVEQKLLKLAFEELGLEKLNCEVLESNQSVIRMHEKFGFRREGSRRAHVIKDGERVDVCLLGMLRAEWLEPDDQAQQFRARFG